MFYIWNAYHNFSYMYILIVADTFEGFDSRVIEVGVRHIYHSQLNH